MDKQDTGPLQWQDPMQMVVAEYEARLESYRRQLAEVEQRLSICSEYADKLRGEKAEQFYRARAGLPVREAIVHLLGDSWTPQNPMWGIADSDDKRDLAIVHKWLDSYAK